MREQTQKTDMAVGVMFEEPKAELPPVVIDYVGEEGEVIEAVTLKKRLDYLNSIGVEDDSNESREAAEIQNILDSDLRILENNKKLIRGDNFTNFITEKLYEFGWLNANMDAQVKGCIDMTATAKNMQQKFYEEVTIAYRRFWYHTG